MAHSEVNKMADSWWGKKLNQISTARPMWGATDVLRAPFIQKQFVEFHLGWAVPYRNAQRLANFRAHSFR